MPSPTSSIHPIQFSNSPSKGQGQDGTSYSSPSGNLGNDVYEEPESNYNAPPLNNNEPSNGFSQPPASQGYSGPEELSSSSYQPPKQESNSYSLPSEEKNKTPLPPSDVYKFPIDIDGGLPDPEVSQGSYNSGGSGNKGLSQFDLKYNAQSIGSEPDFQYGGPDDQPSSFPVNPSYAVEDVRDFAEEGDVGNSYDAPSVQSETPYLPPVKSAGSSYSPPSKPPNNSYEVNPKGQTGKDQLIPQQSYDVNAPSNNNLNEGYNPSDKDNSFDQYRPPNGGISDSSRPPSLFDEYLGPLGNELANDISGNDEPNTIQSYSSPSIPSPPSSSYSKPLDSQAEFPSYSAPSPNGNSKPSSTYSKPSEPAFPSYTGPSSSSASKPISSYQEPP